MGPELVALSGGEDRMIDLVPADSYDRITLAEWHYAAA
jgi:hypothetical protein